jgi:hypothetical protein
MPATRHSFPSRVLLDQQEMELLVAECFARLSEHTRALFVLEKILPLKGQVAMTESEEKEVLVRLATSYEAKGQLSLAADSLLKALYFDAESTVWGLAWLYVFVSS